MNILHWIVRHGDDIGFEPVPALRLTMAQPGTLAKRNVLCDRVEAGQELFHPADRNCFDKEKR